MDRKNEDGVNDNGGDPEHITIPDRIGADNNNTVKDVPEGITDHEIRITGSRDSAEHFSRLSKADDIIVIPGSTMSIRKKVAVFQDFVHWLNKTEKQYGEKRNVRIRVWKENSVLLASYFVGLLSFVICFHLPTLPVLPFPLINNLEDWNPDVVPYIWWTGGGILVEVMWAYTLLRRIVFLIAFLTRAEVAKVQNGSPESGAEDTAASSSIWQRLLGAGALIYHLVFGAWLGWANNTFCGYLTSDKEFVISGLLTYMAGELTVTIGEVYFLCRKTSGTALFRKFRLAAEIFVWTGFALVSFTLPAVFVFLGRFAILTYLVNIQERPSCVC